MFAVDTNIRSLKFDLRLAKTKISPRKLVITYREDKLLLVLANLPWCTRDLKTLKTWRDSKQFWNIMSQNTRVLWRCMNKRSGDLWIEIWTWIPRCRYLLECIKNSMYRNKRRRSRYRQFLWASEGISSSAAHIGGFKTLLIILKIRISITVTYRKLNCLARNLEA